jgi:hypothetical protein
MLEGFDKLASRFVLSVSTYYYLCMVCSIKPPTSLRGVFCYPGFVYSELFSCGELHKSQAISAHLM